MLEVAGEREVEGDLCLHDLGHGLPIRPGTVDGAISISAVQWLCNAVRHPNRAVHRMRGGTAAGHCTAPHRAVLHLAAMSCGLLHLAANRWTRRPLASPRRTPATTTRAGACAASSSRCMRAWPRGRAPCFRCTPPTLSRRP